MAKTKPFDEYVSQYEDWFERNKFAFESELRAIREQLPKSNNGIEIGVGSGRFAIPSGIKIGVDPSRKMGKIAQKGGIEVIDGVAESLPFADSQFDFALMVTTICFVDDMEVSFQEAYRVLKPDGFLIIGFIDRKSPVGRLYQQHKEESVFYRIATFYAVGEVVSNLKKAGFNNFSFTQTIFHNLAEIRDIEQIRTGYGEGSFVVIRAIK
ncbi:MAG: methyltransferase domain-containing protein [Methanosarcinales archaeon]|uniref:Methyltransferase domain-containing protein n=1 Tax=Candidatus Ethanoperedens thermophilum TaxID=2766897 RepID=A0A848D9X6_9EURY|nr:methyltransferase domain-containing protein [Candidatus Ethanoperedens thermophilum]